MSDEEDLQIAADVAELRATIYGNLIRQEPGLLKDFRALNAAVEQLKCQQAETSALITLIAGDVRKLVTRSDRQELEQELNRNTPLSQLAHQVALIIAVGIFLVAVFDARRYILGGSSISMYTIMLGSRSLPWERRRWPRNSRAVSDDLPRQRDHRRRPPPGERSAAVADAPTCGKGGAAGRPGGLHRGNYSGAVCVTAAGTEWEAVEPDETILNGEWTGATRATPRPSSASKRRAPSSPGSR